MDAHDRSSLPSRRAFVRGLGSVGVGAGMARVSRGSSTDSTVARLFEGLSSGQRNLLCFPSDHPLRERYEQHWAVVAPSIGDLNPRQQGQCWEIFQRLCSKSGCERFARQMEDDSGGFEAYHIAFFGTPGTGRRFEWLLTGRHLTIRANGLAGSGGVLGGPFFYGHDPARSGNAIGGVWDSQRAIAEAIVERLDDDEREIARSEGVRVGLLDRQIREHVSALVEDLLGTFCEVDRRAAWARIEASGGLEAHRWIDGDRSGKRCQGAWKLEGPALSWTFLGKPHVHAWLHVKPWPAS